MKKGEDPSRSKGARQDVREKRCRESEIGNEERWNVDRRGWKTSMDRHRSQEGTGRSETNAKLTKERHTRNDSTQSTNALLHQTQIDGRQHNDMPDEPEIPVQLEPRRWIPPRSGARMRGTTFPPNYEMPILDQGIRPLRYMNERRNVETRNPGNLPSKKPNSLQR